LGLQTPTRHVSGSLHWELDELPQLFPLRRLLGKHAPVAQTPPVHTLPSPSSQELPVKRLGEQTPERHVSGALHWELDELPQLFPVLVVVPDIHAPAKQLSPVRHGLPSSQELAFEI